MALRDIWTKAGEPLPPGRLCSRSPPVPCPPGTFLSGKGPHNTPFCHPCPAEFFNPWHGQNACFPCGSEASQPEEGKDTCVCRRPGRVFQVCPLAVGPGSAYRCRTLLVSSLVWFSCNLITVLGFPKDKGVRSQIQGFKLESQTKAE